MLFGFLVTFLEIYALLWQVNFKTYILVEGCWQNDEHTQRKTHIQGSSDVAKIAQNIETSK